MIVVGFSDTKTNEKITPAEWEKALFSKGEYKDKSVTGQSVYGSMNDYYQEISCGKFSVTGKVFAPVTCGKKRSDYSTTSNRNTMFNETLDLLLARDGKDALRGFDGLFFLYAGNRVQTQRGGIYWPHKSNLRYQGKSWNYFICPEGGQRMSSISVMSHEFGHMLGLPDLYAKPENPGSEGVGVWCTMSTGHGQDGKPLHFCAWSKDQLGWIKPCVIDPRVKQKLILAPIENVAERMLQSAGPARCERVFASGKPAQERIRPRHSGRRSAHLASGRRQADAGSIARDWRAGRADAISRLGAISVKIERLSRPTRRRRANRASRAGSQ